MRKTLNIGVAVIIIIILGSIFTNYYAHSRISYALASRKKAIEFPDKYEAYRTIKCKPYNFLSHEYIFVGQRPERPLDAMFYNLTSGNFINDNYNFNYTGGTTVKNTTFEELLAMVKKDCSQFQESSSIDDNPNNTRWVYYKADPPKSDEQIQQEKAQALKEDADYIRERLTGVNQEHANYIIELYGKWEHLTDEELIQFEKDNYHKYLNFTDEQKNKLKSFKYQSN